MDGERTGLERDARWPPLAAAAIMIAALAFRTEFISIIFGAG
jgi:hypothetical protein